MSLMLQKNSVIKTQSTRMIFILVLALVVRCLGITFRPIWYDEAFSMLFSEKGLDAMLYGTLTPTGAGSADIHPLGYYTLLWLWMKAWGNSLIAARVLSILAGVITVYLVYLVAQEAVSDTKTAYLSMLLAALAPFQIHYAQEIRMYSWLAMWLLLATYAYQRGSKSGKWEWWSIFSVSAAFAQYTHNLAAFYLISLALLSILQRDWRSMRAVALSGVGALILYAPWLVQLPAQFTKVQTAYWVERPDISKLFTLLIVYVTNTPLPTGMIAPILSLVLIIVIIGFIQTVRSVRQTGQLEGLWLLYLSFAPPLFLFLFSQWRSVYIERALLPCGAIFCIWLAWVISRTNLSKLVQYSLLGLLGISSIAGIYQHVTYRDFPYGPFKELDRSLHQRMESQDIIIHSNKLTMLPAMFFDRELPQSFIGDLPGSPSDTLAPATQEVLNIKAEKDIRTATINADRIWYIIYQRVIDEHNDGASPTFPDIQYLNSRYNLEKEETWDGLRLLLYTKEQ